MTDQSEAMHAIRDRSWQNFVPRRFVDASLLDFKPPLSVALIDWIGEVQTGDTGMPLLLVGPVGAGKTHAGIACLRELHKLSWSVEFKPVDDLLDLLRPGEDPSEFTDLVDVDALMVDDLGSDRATEWSVARIGQLVNNRWLHNQPTIATTNLELPDLEQAIGARTYSRLVDGATMLRIDGPDRRKT